MTTDVRVIAHRLETEGNVEGAYQAYLEAGFVDDATRLLLQHQGAVPAADLLLGHVTRAPRPLSEEDRVRGMRAAELLETGGAFARACEVLAWLGDAESSARVAMRAQSSADPVEAAACLVRVGDATRAIEQLLFVRRDDPRYSIACVECARALARGAAMTMELDRFLADFIRRGPDDDNEAEALYSIASAYAREGFPENAIEALKHIEMRRPGYRDASTQARRLEGARRGAVQDFARVLEEEARFRGRSEPAPRAPKKSADSPGGLDSQTQHQADDAATQLAIESFVPGVTLAKRYRLDELIGRGGMSLVYRATDLELKDAVALKIFTQPTNEDALARFKQEVLLARQLLHRNVVRVYDLGTALGARFLTMELLVGEDLHTKLVRGTSLREGIDFLIQACAGLEAAHQVGVVHRDVKPENLFVTKDNILKVTDFGIAKQIHSSGLTVAGMVVGTPEYMAPEQAHGHMTVTHAADLYSLGVILYFLVCGALPFRHAELVPLLMMHVTQKPEPPRFKNPNVHPDVEALVLQLLEKEPALRPPSARATGERLIDLRLRGVV